MGRHHLAGRKFPGPDQPRHFDCGEKTDLRRLRGGSGHTERGSCSEAQNGIAPCRIVFRHDADRVTERCQPPGAESLENAAEPGWLCRGVEGQCLTAAASTAAVLTLVAASVA